MTPIVPVSSDPSCAALSMPRAEPGNDHAACLPQIVARAPGRSGTPAALALRAPTIATIGLFEQATRLPFTVSSGGAFVQLRQSPRIKALPHRQIARPDRLDVPSRAPRRLLLAKMARCPAAASRRLGRGMASSATAAVPKRSDAIGGRLIRPDAGRTDQP